MDIPELTIGELKDILRDAAGEGEEEVPDIKFPDTEFSDLGYDSLALLEVEGRIERRYGITLEDSGLAEAATPRLFLMAVNLQLAAQAAKWR